MTRLAAYVVLFLILAPLWAVQGQAETFNTKKTMFRNAGGKWRIAFIDIEPNKIEVHRVGTKLRKKELVAKFESAEVESEIKGFRRTNLAAGIAGAGYGTVAGLVIAAKLQQGDVISKDGGRYVVLGVDTKKALLATAAVTGIVVAAGMTKAKRPYAKVTNGVQSIELRVHKRNTSRFMSALETFKANNP